MRRKTALLGAGLATGATLGASARRWWDRHAGSGPSGALGRSLPDGVDSVPLALLQATSTRMLEGNRATWRQNGGIFDALEEAIRGARHSIHVDLYIWKPGATGERIARAVAARARSGVAVRILVDPIGSPGFEPHLRRIVDRAGCQVRYFRPIRKHPLSITGRNHRKLVVVDGRTGFTGGFGIASEWAGDGLSPSSWRDTHVEVEGPVVGQMQVAFANHWVDTGGALIPAAEFERTRPAGTARAAYVTSMDVKGLSHARWLTRIALAAARRRAWIANAYFVPPPEILGRLCATPRAGVETRLLLPGPHQDHPTVTFIQRRLYSRLGRSGVSVFEYLPSMMHAKTMLIDGRLAVVGSMNLDVLSMEFLEEGSLLVDDVAFAEAFERCWRDDLVHSRQVAGPGVGPVAPEAARGGPPGHDVAPVPA